MFSLASPPLCIPPVLLKVNLELFSAFLEICFIHGHIKDLEEFSIEEFYLSWFNSEFFQTCVTATPVYFNIS